MDHVTRGDEIINASAIREQDEDHRDAMEVDGAPSMMIDSSHSHDNESTPIETNTPASPMVTTTTEELPNPDLGSTSSDAPRGSREPPVFDEDTERPRQRRRYHVTVEDENDTAVQAEPVTDAPAATEGTSTVNDEVAVLEAAPPRLSDLSIHTPRSSTPPAVEMQDVLPTAPSANRSPQSPHLGTVPLPDVPPPPRDPNAPPDPIMEAARRLTSAPDGNSDQMQADLALLAPYIAAQAMAAAFQPGGRPPGNPGANQANAPPNGPQPPQEGQGGANNAGPPPPPLPFPFPFMFGGNSERPADHKRAERLANGLKVVEDGLLKRWNAVCGEEGAVCAVCYSELLEEPGIEQEKDKGKAKEEEEKVPEEQPKQDEGTGDEAHERALREALERREQMERLEKEERERKLETAVLAFPCAHVFHRTCLLPWLSRHTTCPTCRFDIDPKSDTLTLPADDGVPPFLGPNGLNFGDFFTVGPVLRVPRAQAPNLGPRPTAGTRRAERSAQSRREPGNNTQPSNENGEPRPAGEPAGNPAPPPSMADLFDGLFGSLFESAGIPTPRRSNNNNTQTPGDAAQVPPAEASPAQEQASQEPAAPPSAPEQSTEEATAPSNTTQPPPPDSGAIDPSSLDDPPPLRARPSAPIPTDYRPIDYSRPLAMFGRPSPRRPPQPITPAWMRTPRPPVAVATSSTEASGSASSSSTAETPRTPSSTTPTELAPRASDSTDGSRSFGLRSIVSNLLPRRLNSTRRASSSTPSIRSTGSNESAGPPSASQTGVRSVSGPLPPRTGIRAILHGPTAMLRDLASRRPADPEGSSTARDSVDSVPSNPPRTSVDDDMPELENDTEDGSMYSEDDAHHSEEDEDDDMPALEPVGPRAPRTATAPSNDQAATAVQEEDGDDDMPALEPVGPRAPRTATAPSIDQPATADNAQPPPLVPRPAQRPAPPLRSASRHATDPPRPSGDETANNMMENIITLRIDLGHADGRDETIIVPLLFNPNGRADQANRGAPRPAAAQPPPSRARTPPPQKKWVPPEPIKTFRQVVEEKEREAGWRCDDPACLLGPADDEEPSDEHIIKPMYSIMRSLSPEDEPVRYKVEDGIRVYAGGEDVRVKGENPVCAHQLHPECLVTSARVNGWGPDHNNKSSSRVTLRCPMCRLEGTVERDIWEAGVEAENAEA